MQIQFADALELGKPRRTREGYLAVRAKAARAGVYDYLGREVDPEGKHFSADQVVKVYRPEDEVFATDAVHSFLMKPITDEHPSQPVTADNWRQHAKGVNAGALRDGQYLAFDLVVMDRAAIEAVDAGKKQLSNGYACDLAFESGTTPLGDAYDAVQRQIRGNHIALVRAGRAGPECAIADGGKQKFEICDAATVILTALEDQETPTMPHTLIIDGLQVPNVSDEAKAAIEKLQGQITGLTADKAAAEKQVGELTATVQTKDGEIAGLNAKLKDAEVTPAKLQLLADARAKVVAAAQALQPGIVVDGKTDAEIRKEAVGAKLGDAAKDMSDAAIEGAFAALTKDAKPAPGAVIHAPVASPNVANIRDAARAARYA
jgi:hypothetical protein